MFHRPAFVALAIALLALTPARAHDAPRLTHIDGTVSETTFPAFAKTITDEWDKLVRVTVAIGPGEGGDYALLRDDEDDLDSPLTLTGPIADAQTSDLTTLSLTIDDGFTYRNGAWEMDGHFFVRQAAGERGILNLKLVPAEETAVYLARPAYRVVRVTSE